MADEVRYEAGGGVARLTIDRPARANALTWSAVRALRAGVAEAAGDAAVRVVVVTGAGDGPFCAGADLADVAALAGADPPDGSGPADLAGLFADLWSLGRPTIARVGGHALGGGLALALACDLVVAVEGAEFATPEIDVGLWPFVATVPLVRAMPPKRALELMLTGRRIGAREAERIGFVNQVVGPGDLDAAVDRLAATLAAKPPAAMALGRDSFYAVWDRAAADALAYLHPLFTLAATGSEAAEGLAAFVQRRPPLWADR